MRLFLSLLAVAIYWFLDAYKDTISLHISFKQALLSDFSEPTIGLKIAISCIIFIFVFFKLAASKNKSEVLDNYTENMLIAIRRISDIILSTMPLPKQLSEIVTILEDNLHFKTVFIGSFEKDSVYRLNQNSSLDIFGIKEHFTPQQNNLNLNSIEGQITTIFYAQAESVDASIFLNKKTYRLLAVPYRDSNNKKIIGILCALVDPNDTQDYAHIIATVSDQIGFAVSFAKKRDDAFRSQNIFTENFGLLDKELNIPTFNKLQERIEHEIKRSQRYGSMLSLILVEVDYLRNLINVLGAQEAKDVKKEIATLLKKTVRDTDLFGKWNDDIFAIVAPDIDFRAAKSFAEKINRTLETHRFNKIGKITCSYGITAFSPKDSVGTLRLRAENALREASANGGNKIEIKILV